MAPDVGMCLRFASMTRRSAHSAPETSTRVAKGIG